MSRREDQIVRLANGVAELEGQLQEIDRWFPRAKQLNDVVFLAKGKTVPKLLRCFPQYHAQPPIGVVLWATLEAKLFDREERGKWILFKSLRYRLDPQRQAEQVAEGQV
ncbi:hypothetical protein ZWY2020_030554 [Hordeum vulgare]|nr:hypothetical protein ZWY2020_030554 [Hordeum vulgare]